MDLELGKEFLYVVLFVLCLWRSMTNRTTNLFSISRILSFQACCKMAVTQNAVIWDWHNPKKKIISWISTMQRWWGEVWGDWKERGREEGREGEKKEKQVTDRENIWKPHINKGFVSKIYEELSKLNSKKKTLQTIQTKNGKRYRHFTKEGIQKTNKPMKSWSTLEPQDITTHLSEWLKS